MTSDHVSLQETAASLLPLQDGERPWIGPEDNCHVGNGDGRGDRNDVNLLLLPTPPAGVRAYKGVSAYKGVRGVRGYKVAGSQGGENAQTLSSISASLECFCRVSLVVKVTPVNESSRHAHGSKDGRQRV